MAEHKKGCRPINNQRDAKGREMPTMYKIEE